MPSPIPLTRLLPKDLFPSVDIGTCSSPLSKHTCGSTLQVPQHHRRFGKVTSRLWTSVIHWKDLRSVESVGSGGFGSVYRAEYLGRCVALKKVKKWTKNRLASRQSFWAELNAAHLSHANIVRVLAATTCVPADLENEGSIGTILMEFVEKNLQQVIHGTEPLEPDRWLRFSKDIIRGLDFLHSHQVVHLDIKPANVLVSSTDACKIADFGCSVKLDRTVGAHLSQVGGTYTHRAPELLKGEGVSPRADVFSYGVTMWQMMTRQEPYTGDRHCVIYSVVAHQLRPPLQDLRSGPGLACRTLLTSCWDAEPQNRPSAAEVLDILTAGVKIT